MKSVRNTYKYTAKKRFSVDCFLSNVKSEENYFLVYTIWGEGSSEVLPFDIKYHKTGIIKPQPAMKSNIV